MIRRNDRILPSPSIALEGMAPLIHAFDGAQSLIRNWKDHRGLSLEALLFQMPHRLKRALMENHFFAVIPIPQSQKRAYQRGHDSAKEVAAYFSRSIDIPLLPLLELEEPDPKRQTGKNRFDRDFSPNPFRISRHFDSSNSYFFSLEERILEGRTVHLLLVDDIITSGSTMTKAADTIRGLLPRSKIWAGSLGYRPKSKCLLS